MCKDRYPIPLLADLLDAPSQARIYTKIDLHSAYYLICIAESNEWKTTFRTKYGLFEWRVMPFGLSNTLFTFQRFMNDLFLDILDVCVVIYLDDILIYLENLDNHRKHVKEVLGQLKDNRLYVLLEKYEFHKD